MPMIEVTEQEFEQRRQGEILDRIGEALNRGDDQELAELFREWAPPAQVLWSAKKIMGAQWVRERGFDTSRADREYGPGWLDA